MILKIIMNILQINRNRFDKIQYWKFQGNGISILNYR